MKDHIFNYGSSLSIKSARYFALSATKFFQRQKRIFKRSDDKTNDPHRKKEEKKVFSWEVALQIRPLLAKEQKPFYVMA